MIQCIAHDWRWGRARHLPTALPTQSPIIELNTTPLIDVLLVLLVMLIITIPAPTQKLRLDLPQPVRGAPPSSTVNLIEIAGDGTLIWNGRPVTRGDLADDLAATQQMQPIPELHLRPAPDARYLVVADVLSMLKREHIRKFGFVGNEAYADW